MKKKYHVQYVGTVGVKTTGYDDVDDVSPKLESVLNEIVEMGGEVEYVFCNDEPFNFCIVWSEKKRKEKERSVEDDIIKIKKIVENWEYRGDYGKTLKKVDRQLSKM